MRGRLPSEEPQHAPDPSVSTHLEVRMGDAPLDPETLRVDDRLREVTSAVIVVSAQQEVEAASACLRAVLQAVPRLEEAELLLDSAACRASGALDVIEALDRVVAERAARRTVGFLLDAEADAFAALAKRPTSLTHVVEATRALVAKGSSVRWWVPVLPELPHRFEALFDAAVDLGADPILVPGWALPFSAASSVALDPDLTLFAQDFVTYRLLEEERALLTPARLAYYTWLEAAIDGAGPQRPAHARPVATLDLSRSAELSSSNRATLSDSHVGPPELERAPGVVDRLRGQVQEMGGVVLDGDRALLKWAMSQPSLTLKPPKALRPETLLRKVTVIGAYGGEHIGDMAILGGVLLRVHERFGVLDAVLMSQRAEHTRRLVKNLDLPVRILVEPYEHDNIKVAVSESDGVVYAGGPLMDLPKQLVRHLYAASIARAQGKPLILEGIGAGPFTRAPSEWVGRRLTTMASAITVRTATDARQGIMKGLQPQIGRDPAFDYMDSRGPELGKTTDSDRGDVAALLEGTAGKLLIGINLRPIRAMFTVGAPASQKEARTKEVVEAFEARLAAAMRRFAEVSTKEPCFIYFSMNSIQFGSPDLRSAYAIQRHLGADLDYRVWQADPGIDGVLTLLRKLDLAIAMRFHANIFALSQGVPTIGVDYRPGKKDKVHALHLDRGTVDQVCRIDTMSEDWMVDQLLRLSTASR